MRTMETELQRLDNELYRIYCRSMEIAELKWLPYIKPKKDSHNSYPHVKGVMHHIDRLLYDDENETFLNGSSYPFLVNSDTSGDLFLSTFVHIMRNYGMHVIMSSSESDLDVSDVELSKAGILADAILRCTSKTGKDGHEAVYIMGEGLITDPKRKRAKVSIDSEKPYELKFSDDREDKQNDSSTSVKLYPFSIKFD